MQLSVQPAPTQPPVILTSFSAALPVPPAPVPTVPAAVAASAAAPVRGVHTTRGSAGRLHLGCSACGGRCEHEAGEILRGRGANAAQNAGRISIVCIGDSITAGIGASDFSMSYPAQLQKMLGDRYIVTNLGACGAALQRSADIPYRKRLQWQAALKVRADIIVIMLGHNDARPPNWRGASGAVQFEADFKTMLAALQHDGQRPMFYVAVPPPFYGALSPSGAHLQAMNIMIHSIVNDVFPALVPRISTDAGIKTTPIPVFEALGGRSLARPDWFPDGCHPNDLGYMQLAQAVCIGLGLDPAGGCAPPMTATAEVDHKDHLGPQGLRLAVSPMRASPMPRQFASAAVPMHHAVASSVATARLSLAAPRTPLAAPRSLARAGASPALSPVRVGKAAAARSRSLVRTRSTRADSPVHVRVARAASPVQLCIAVPAPLPLPLVRSR